MKYFEYRGWKLWYFYCGKCDRLEYFFVANMKDSDIFYCGKCDRFVEAGGNFIDTADCYSRGAAEEVFLK